MDEWPESSCTQETTVSLLRARLAAIVDTTLDPLILLRPLRDAAGRVEDFTVSDINGTHAREGGDRAAGRMHLASRSPELFQLYRRVLDTGGTESLRRVWTDAHPDDPHSTAGWADVRVTAVEGDLVVSWRNVDADVAAEELLRTQALQDHLTELPNRRALSQLITAAPTPFGLFFIDVDDFKSINDTNGHAAGDAVLVELGQRLTAASRMRDVVGRLAGDEFVVLARRVADEDELRHVARRLLAVGDRPYELGEARVTATVSVGALLVTERRTVEEVLRYTDDLMYAAKRTGPGHLRIAVMTSPPGLGDGAGTR
ncbi:GGDEF domain-containing protein [Cellulomonas aerilata]|uniref:GGDEF domain-containing protein n=1 Tax=Cellulomonas aerilata TaxID=515326 RepID=A0A512DG11_9CELL|nr:GGDEF domain-containing protein [Cellulomonas aerilata]GEO35130.1 hypothetical protein CAE01nite_28550 [Cellulomonas aerilata]